MRPVPYLVALALFGAAPARSPRDDIVIADFEGPTYAGWQVLGTAFGDAPARGTLPGQMHVSGYLGRGLVNSYLGGDGSTGRLVSPEFIIARRWINFLIGGGMHPGRTCMNLLLEGKVLRTATGPNDRPGGSERLDWASWDVADLDGRPARIEIVDEATEGWGHINVDQITMSDETMAEDIRTDVPFDETYRPQFHFTPKVNWTNDPNGLVYYKGEYHLFFQHNPFGINWGNMTWGHAVSRDLVHWEYLPHAIEPDELGTIFSGSAVVDHHNTTGFNAGREKAIVAIYTAAGGTSEASKGKPFTQCIAYSADRGRTWTKWQGNPVLGHIAAENRDPKVVWHAPTRRWVMALYLKDSDFALYRSADLKVWEPLQTIAMPDCGECPDFFEAPIVGEPGQTTWVLTAANGRYMTGAFDGTRFTPDGPPRHADYGANFYAVQTYSDIPGSDGRRIQIAWMNGGAYPRMPFNQQMSFPCALTVRRTSDGLRLFRWPVREIERLRGEGRKVAGRTLVPGTEVTLDGKSELWDVRAEFEVGDRGSVGLRVRGEPIVYDAGARTLSCLGRSAPLEPLKGRIRLRVLVDRTSIEAFGNDGRVSLTSCVLLRSREQGVSAFAEGAQAKLVSLTGHELRSAWKP